MDLTEMLPSKIMFELVIYSTQWQHVSLVQERAWCYLDIQPLFGMMVTRSCDATGCLLLGNYSYFKVIEDNQEKYVMGKSNLTLPLLNILLIFKSQIKNYYFSYRFSWQQSLCIVLINPTFTGLIYNKILLIMCFSWILQFCWITIKLYTMYQYSYRLFYGAKWELPPKCLSWQQFNNLTTKC